jgi:type IV secretory pathway TraG/TraD family ATPase VirD4
MILKYTHSINNGDASIGIQSISQLEFLYGQHEAYAISDLFNTSVYFRSPKGRVARWVSEDLGEQTLDEVRESRACCIKAN